MPALSVVVPVYDNWWLTARCLCELERLRDGTLPFETIVVDNASSDETPRAIAGFPWVRYIRNETNANFAGACNAGVRAAQSPLTLLLNNDAFPLGDALTPLVRAFDRDEVAIAGGALFFEDGAVQAAGLVLLPNAHWHYDCRNLPRTLDAVTQPRDALAVSGAAMAVRTRWFVEAGGFDEAFVNGFEDVDLCMRARERGFSIAYVPTARFAHYEAASANRFAREAENERRFYDRWARALGALPRTARGEVGAIALESAATDRLETAALDDLERALRDFGHPVVRGRIPPWRRFDRRYRRAASLAWLSNECDPPGVSIARRGESTTIRTRGAASFEVPWLPCASEKRASALALRRSRDPSCAAIGVAGGSDSELLALEQAGGFSTVRITPEMLLGGGAAVEVACVVHLGLTDDAAFGNVVAAQAGLPAVVLASAELQAIFAPDVALAGTRAGLPELARRTIGDVSLRERYGALVAADARRRFSPRRSAIRVVDLLAAARFGPERPGAARSNAPL